MSARRALVLTSHWNETILRVGVGVVTVEVPGREETGEQGRRIELVGQQQWGSHKSQLSSNSIRMSGEDGLTSRRARGRHVSEGQKCARRVLAVHVPRIW